MGLKDKNNPSFSELKKISARQNETHNKLNQIIDVRKQEVDKLREQLYVEVQNFREAHQAEVRRSIEWAVEMSNKSLPWWKRSLANIRDRAKQFMELSMQLTKAEADRIHDEVKKAQDEEREKSIADQAALKKAREDAAAAEKLAQTQTPTDDLVDDGYGVKVPVEEVAADV